MDLIEKYFKNGCTNCDGGEVFYLESAFIYKCRRCKAFAHAHREETKFADMHEPFQYLANQYINSLRNTLEHLFNQLWRDKVPIIKNNETRYESLINVIYPHNVREIENYFVNVINIDHSSKTCTVFAYEENRIIDDVKYSKLKPVTNREKAYLWLTQSLNLDYDLCKIGYLSESQLKTAIEMCNKHIHYARKRAARISTGAT